LIEDSEIDLTAFIAERVAEGMAEKEDDAFFNGDGTATYASFTGLLNVAGVNEVTMSGATFASMDADDLIDMVDATPAGALRNAKFYMHRSIMSIVRKLKDSQGQYIYQRPSEGGPATIWGYPVVLVEVMPTSADTDDDTSFVLFGDLKKAAVMGVKGGVRAEMFTSGIVRNVANNADINLITSDRKAVRFIERVGYTSTLENAATKLTTAAASA
jgi:HK97 family phage major capsid protein